MGRRRRGRSRPADSRLTHRRRHRRRTPTVTRTRILKGVLGVLAILLVVGIAGFLWYAQPQPLLPEATAALSSTPTVTVSDDHATSPTARSAPPRPRHWSSIRAGVASEQARTGLRPPRPPAANPSRSRASGIVAADPGDDQDDTEQLLDDGVSPSRTLARTPHHRLAQQDDRGDDRRQPRQRDRDEQVADRLRGDARACASQNRLGRAGTEVERRRSADADDERDDHRRGGRDGHRARPAGAGRGRRAG